MEKRADKLLKKCKLAGYYLVRVMFGCCIIGVLYILLFIGLFCVAYFTNDAGSGNPIISNLSAARIPIGAVMFIIPFSLGAIYFRAVFRSWNHRALIITTALLISWFAEKLAILGISTRMYGPVMWNLQLRVYRISKGDYPIVPWFTIEYILLTMLGCIVLGFIASKEKKVHLNQTGQL